MSIVGSEQWMYSSGREFYDFPIEQSLRFNQGDSAYLSRTPATAGNRKTWTFSAWIKLGSLTQGERGIIFQSNFGGPTIYQDSGLRFAHAWDPAGTDYIRETVAVFRDPSAWYHVVWWCDTTQAGTRWKIYVNGTEQTLQTPAGNNGEPAQNTDLNINSTNAHTIGNFADFSFFDGYMAEVNFIDGQALDATSFGEFKSGIWTPVDTAGLTFGTNGFRLQYGDSAAIGDDTSGNTNDWTVNNLVASDVVLDSPTNNFATMNPLAKGTGTVTFSEGNLKSSFTFTLTTTEHGSTYTLPQSGKWYWEQRFTGALTDGSQALLCGIMDVDTLTVGNSGNKLTSSGDYVTFYTDNNTIYINNSLTAYTSEITDQTSAIVGFAVDMDNGHLWVHVNGTYINGTPNFSTGGNKVASPNTDSTYMPFFNGNGGGSGTWIANFGQDSTFANNTTAGGNVDANGYGDFKYAPPSGYLSLCSANLPTGAIDTLNDETPEDYFNTLLWTGDGSNPRTLSGLDFAPDLIWHKSRSAASMDSHAIQDSVRGFDLNNNLYTNLTGSETAYPNRGVINSVNSTGFTFNENASDYSTADGLNQSGVSFVSWNWKAGGSGVSNTDGSITSTVSVGATSQQNWFSIVSYTGTGSNATVGHGLNTEPQMIITKARANGSSYWLTYHSGLASPSTSYMALNTSDAVDTGGASVWNSTAPTSSVFSVGTSTWINPNGGDMIAYCFANAENLCRVGKYTGNGSADGVFVYTGHKPKYVMLKRSDSTGGWNIIDAERSPINPNDKRLEAQGSGAEGTNTAYNLDFLSNGFKLRTTNVEWNASGGSYIFLSISEQPFKFANAR